MTIFFFSRCYRSNSSVLIALGFVFSLLVFRAVESQVCTRLTSEKKVKMEKIIHQCNQSYQARCGWFSLQMCTFYEIVDCVKEANQTITIYRIVEDCCPGYYYNEDRHCIRDSVIDYNKQTSRKPVFTSESSEQSTSDNVAYNSSKVDPEAERSNYRDDDDGLFLGLSHGAYAGIVCTILLLACVALLTALHYHKRHKLQKKMKNSQTDHEVQQMLPLKMMGDIKTDAVSS